MTTRGVSKEVKEEIISKVKAGEPVATLAKQYGISDKAIYNWIGSRTTKKVSWLDYAKLKRENQQLKEIIGVLSLEVEKSKKKDTWPTILKSNFPKSASLLSQTLYLLAEEIFTTDQLSKARKTWNLKRLFSKSWKMIQHMATGELLLPWELARKE